MAGGVGVGRFRGDGLELAAVADAGDVQRCGARLAGALEHLHRIPRAAGVAQDDDAVLRVDRALVGRQVRRVRRLGLDARLAQHPRPLVGRVPTRPDADQQQPAARQPRGGHPGRVRIGKQPRELLRLRLHGIAHLRHAVTVRGRRPRGQSTRRPNGRVSAGPPVAGGSGIGATSAVFAFPEVRVGCRHDRAEKEPHREGPDRRQEASPSRGGLRRRLGLVEPDILA